MMKRGVTLIELVVAMSLFAVISTLAIGAYVTVTNMKALTASMRESQQKMRIATETITRLAKQADIVIIGAGGSELDLYFNTKGTPSATRFIIGTNANGNKRLEQSTECLSPLTTSLNCTQWSQPVSMLSENLELTTGSAFSKIADGPTPELKIILNGKYGDAATSSYYKDDFNIETAVILENVK